MADDELIAEFTHQAEAFAASPVMHMAETLAGVVGLVPPGADGRWLEAACGPGIIARALASRVGSVHGVDLTPAMVAVAEREAARAGAGNLDFSVGDATDLAFADGSFDGAITRFSLHHVPVPGRMLAELARVVRPGGLVVVADHVTVADGPAAAWHGQLERLRDPSHWACLTPAHMRALGSAAGLELETGEVVPFTIDYEEWLQRGSGGPGNRELIAAALAEPPGAADSFRVDTGRDGRRQLHLLQWSGRWRRR